MEPQDVAPTNGRHADAQVHISPRHELVIHLLTQRCETLRVGMDALKAENTDLRLELRRLARSGTPSAWPGWGVDALASWDVALPAGIKAPGDARIALASWLEWRVPSRVLEDAQLLASELVTNSVLHAEVEAANVIHVGVELATGLLRLHVEDGGITGAVAPRAPGVAGGSGYGLNLVAAIATQWGVSRNAGTRVWAELTWSI
jgi:anti-sigma regulatory factor (Ser/Thr protein kinase)